MSTIKAALRAALMGDATLQGYVSDRVFFQYPPEPAVYPLITYNQVGGTGVRADGRLVLDRPRFEVSVWAEDTVDVIADRVVEVLGSMRWPCQLLAVLDLEDAATGMNRKALDFSFTGPF